MKVAAAQISCTPGDLDANLRKVADFAARAKNDGADLVVFPEMTDTGYSMPLIQKCARPFAAATAPFQAIAKRLSIAIVSGLGEREGDKIYNAQVLIDSRGEVLAKYRKTHLVTAAPLDERPVFTPGEKFVSQSFGDFKLGLTICYDLRFPEITRKLAVDHQVDLFVTSSAWPSVRVEHLRVLATARTMENQAYLILCNRVGTDDGVTFCGTSAMIDAGGTVIAAASVEREQIIYGEISREVIDAVRHRMKVFDHRRKHLY